MVRARTDGETHRSWSDRAEVHLEGRMTKAELIDIIANEAEITKVAAEKALKSFTDNVEKCLKKGDKIPLTGFGTWQVSRRKARKGLNPQTKKAIPIPACKV